MSGAAPAARRPAIPPPPAPGGAAPAARAPAPRALPAAGRGAPRSAGLGRTPGGGERAGAGRERVGGGRDAPPCRGSGQSCCPFRAPGAFGDVAAPQGGASPGHPTQRPVGGARAPLRARTRLWARPLPRLRWRGTGSPFPAGPAWGRAHRLLPRAPLAPPQIPGAWGGGRSPRRGSRVGGGGRPVGPRLEPFASWPPPGRECSGGGGEAAGKRDRSAGLGSTLVVVVVGGDFSEGGSNCSLCLAPLPVPARGSQGGESAPEAGSEAAVGVGVPVHTTHYLPDRVALGWGVSELTSLPKVKSLCVHSCSSC